MSSLVWRTEVRRVKDLLPFKSNPRKMSPKQIDDLVKSLKKYGLVEIPAVDTNNRILAGHQRIAVLQLLGKGEDMIDVRIPSRPLTEAEYKGYLIASNAVKGDWDYSVLAECFDIDLLTESGFDSDELADVFADTLEVEEDDFDVDAELAAIKKPKAKLGDVYQLGPHRIACGDSLDPDVVKRLVRDARIDMIYCDSIYNLGVKDLYNKGIGGKAKYGGTVDDSKSDAEYEIFLRTAMTNALSVAKKDCHVFWWCDQRYIGLLQMLYQSLGVENKRVCLWVKGSMVPTPKIAFGKCYEPCVYGLRGQPFLSKTVQDFNEILNKELGGGNELLEQIADSLDLWLHKRIPGKEYSHATQKPCTLHQKPIKRCTRPGDTILDLFSGSASTLIAAESMKRVAYMVDIEPIFVDLAIRRYQKLTGIKAIKIYAA